MGRDDGTCVCDEFVVMPNHVYGILFILDPVRRDPARWVVPAMEQPHAEQG